MKIFKMLLVVAALAAGVFHQNVFAFFDDVAKASNSTTRSPAVTNSFNRAGKSSNGLMGGVGNSLGR